MTNSIALQRWRSLLLASTAAALLSGAAVAQDAAAEPAVTADEADDAGEEVVVTGSYIRGTPEDAALPVDVISANEMQMQGAPSVLELIKSLPISNGVLGDTNQFDSRAQGTEGTGSINLRGLGSDRTLVLLNGRRLAPSPVANGGGGVVDTNLIPLAAIGRIEILKDGAAATYGSDAIGGVVNFITKTNQKGGELNADYRYVDGSDGDYTASLSYGWSNDRADIFVAAGYQFRNELRVLERDFANPTYLENPQGGYTAVGNPGSYIPLGAAFTAIGATQRDVNCAALAGTISGFAGFSGATPVCYSRSTQFDNLVEEEERYQVFGSLNFAVTDRINFHLEGLYSRTTVPNRVTSPSQALVQLPTIEATAAANLVGRLFVPSTNPGYASYVAANPGIFPAGTVGVQLVSYRPFFLGGNPLFGGTGGSGDEREYDALRFSAGFNGDLTDDIGFDVAVTYSENNSRQTAYDVLIDRLQLALRGLGGANCDSQPTVAGIQGTPGVGGCLWFNPFSTAVASNSATGSVNPQYNPAVANSPAVIDWFYKEYERNKKTSLLVVDAVLNGELGWELPGGKVGWAFGGQYRRNRYETQESGFYNTDLNPCVATPDFFVTNCAQQTGPYSFVGSARSTGLTNDVFGVFGEFSLPVTDDFQIQLAARYEDYGGGVGSTFDPKIAARWQATEWLVLRGSVGTTFRGPPAPALDTNPSVNLQQVRGVFRSIDTFGNPNLQPESALAYNVGAVVEEGGFKASVDYWGFKFDNPIVVEPLGPIAAALYPTTSTNRCADPAYAAIRARFTFQDLNGNGFDDDCVAGNVARVRLNYINGTPIETTGVDFSAEYHWDEALGGELTLGGSASWVLTYEVDSLTVDGVLASTAFDAVGKLNYLLVAPPLPEWRGTFYAEYANGPHTIRWTVGYIDGYEDQRTDIYTASVNNSTNGTAVALLQGKKIGSFVTHDVTYRYDVTDEASIYAAIDNVFDEAPPFVRLNLSYDPFTANALGRAVKLGIRARF
ncbi:Vitamin B12 transporter BtuB [Alphaproteobacteria bacterium SO-S41]|nr:Vitamin B12 transporter BtuB [Alphaproteobacteria bacterium SO-S41]